MGEAVAAMAQAKASATARLPRSRDRDFMTTTRTERLTVVKRTQASFSLLYILELREVLAGMKSTGDLIIFG